MARPPRAVIARVQSCALAWGLTARDNTLAVR